MPDMLVKLYQLPDLDEPLKRIQPRGVVVRRPNPWEKNILADWVRAQFTPAWALESEAAFAVRPPSAFIALEKERLIGFACYDCTRKNFFGPTGVVAAARGQGVGRALLLACLHAMREQGHAYAIIGGVGPAQYYVKTVGATLIDDSSPGIYDFGLLRKSHAPDRE
jgi:GNAT superfamily N-acetyltransferase